MKELSQKITSKAQYLELGLSTPVLGHGMTPSGAHIPLPWWACRELKRIELKVYPSPTEVLDKINGQMPQVAIHVSVEDPAFIAYTPDRTAGEADRQLKTTLGKFITKYYPHVPDDMVGEMVAEHLGELNSNYEVLVGKAIAKAYAHAGNTAACMSKNELGYPLASGHHPAEVYDMPNISMAVLRNAEGGITARCMLYDASEIDRRFIRVYGDAKLKKMLTRAGYKAGTWHGAEFRAIAVGAAEGMGNAKLVMPYLDGNGTAGSNATSMVAYVGGKLQSISQSLASKYRTKFGESGAVCSTNTAGIVVLKEIAEAEVSSTCPLSGKAIGLEDATMLYWLNSTITNVHYDAVPEGAEMYTVRRSKHGSFVQVYGPVGIPTFTNQRVTQSIDTDEQRIFDGQLKLDIEYYADEQDWIVLPRYQTHPEGMRIDRNGKLIKLVDAVSVCYIDEDGTNATGLVHQQEVGQGWVKIHSTTRGQDLYAMPNVKVLKTISGRKVVEHVHNVAKTYKGQWEFTRNLTTTWLGHMILEVAKNDEIPTLTNEIGRSLLLDSYRESADMRELVYSEIRRSHRYSNVGGRYVADYNSDNFPLELAMRDKTLSIATDLKVSLMYYALQVQEAEMNAIDYTDQYVGPVQPVVVAVPTNMPAPREVLEGSTALTGSMYTGITGARLLPPTGPSTTSWLATGTSIVTYFPVTAASTA